MAWKPDYVTLAAMKIQLGIDVADTTDDALLQVMITTASRAVDNETNRQFGSAPGERFYRAEYRDELDAYVAVIDDLMSTAGLVVENGDGAAITDYELQPLNAAADGLPWERLVIPADGAVLPVRPRYRLAVTAAPWGWTATPTEAIGAVRLQTSRLFARRESPYGVAGSPDMGSEIRLLAKLDPDVAVAVAGLIRERRPA